jgi:UDP-N-acetylglucosamine 2-epimerase (non-hydrolysing)
LTFIEKILGGEMILITFGTRPEYIKVSPVIKEFQTRGYQYKTFFTGQHTDLLENISPPDYQIQIPDEGNRLDTIVQTILNDEKIFQDITSVMVQGDTTSAFATALAAFHRKISVIHLEAGLRTYDKYSPYPEEFNRRAISALTEFHLVPTDTSYNNLLREGFSDNIYKVGNTVLDNLANTSTTNSNTVIVTLHRREKHAKIQRWFSEINKIAQQNPELEFILPLHPNPEVKKHAGLLSNVTVVNPVGHKKFIEMLSSCKYIITDSGGVQEEAAFLGKPCIVCRDFTERTEGLGTFSILCEKPEALNESLNWALSANLDGLNCPYGDGKASIYIADIYKNSIKKC